MISKLNRITHKTPPFAAINKLYKLPNVVKKCSAKLRKCFIVLVFFSLVFVSATFVFMNVGLYGITFKGMNYGPRSKTKLNLFLYLGFNSTTCYKICAGKSCFLIFPFFSGYNRLSCCSSLDVRFNS